MATKTRKTSRKPSSAVVIPDGSHSSNAANILAHEKADCTPEEHRETLMNAFREMDEDGSGEIDVTELGAMLKAQGHELKEDELKAVMAHLDSDGDGDTLSFEEFMTVMDDLDHGAGLADIAAHFSTEMTSLIGLAAAAKPIWEQLQERENEGEKLTRWQHFQINAGRVLDGSLAQVIILALIVIDVICVICELIILHTKCVACEGVCQAEKPARMLSSGYFDDTSRMLGGAYIPPPEQQDLSCFAKAGVDYTEHTSASPGYVQTQCYNQFSKIQYDWNHWLHIVSVGILGIFAVQLLLLMLVYQSNFFKSTAYVVDTIVVGAALVLENLSSAKEGGLFVALLSWRVLRIVHGIASSVEITVAQKEKAVNETGYELAEEHEEKTNSIYAEVSKEMPNLNAQKDKINAMVQMKTTQAGSEAMAANYLKLCDLVESVHSQLEDLKTNIAQSKDHFLEEDVDTFIMERSLNRSAVVDDKKPEWMEKKGSSLDLQPKGSRGKMKRENSVKEMKKNKSPKASEETAGGPAAAYAK